MWPSPDGFPDSRTGRLFLKTSTTFSRMYAASNERPCTITKARDAHSRSTRSTVIGAVRCGFSLMPRTYPSPPSARLDVPSGVLQWFEVGQEVFLAVGEYGGDLEVLA
jgi:hypothetical protein